MKYIAPITALALAATQVSAGSLITPEVEPMVEVTEEQSAGSSDWIIPLLAVGAIAVMIGNSRGSTPTPC